MGKQERRPYWLTLGLTCKVFHRSPDDLKVFIRRGHLKCRKKRRSVVLVSVTSIQNTIRTLKGHDRELAERALQSTLVSLARASTGASPQIGDGKAKLGERVKRVERWLEARQRKNESQWRPAIGLAQPVDLARGCGPVFPPVGRRKAGSRADGHHS